MGTGKSMNPVPLYRSEVPEKQPEAPVQGLQIGGTGAHFFEVRAPSRAAQLHELRKSHGLLTNLLILVPLYRSEVPEKRLAAEKSWAAWMDCHSLPTWPRVRQANVGAAPLAPHLLRIRHREEFARGGHPEHVLPIDHPLLAHVNKIIIKRTRNLGPKVGTNMQIGRQPAFGGILEPQPVRPVAIDPVVDIGAE